VEEADHGHDRTCDRPVQDALEAVACACSASRGHREPETLSRSRTSTCSTQNLNGFPLSCTSAQAGAINRDSACRRIRRRTFAYLRAIWLHRFHSLRVRLRVPPFRAMGRIVWSVREGRIGELDAKEILSGYRSTNPVHEPRLGDLLRLPDGSGPWRVIDCAVADRGDASANELVVAAVAEQP